MCTVLHPRAWNDRNRLKSPCIRMARLRGVSRANERMYTRLNVRKVYVISAPGDPTGFEIHSRFRREAAEVYKWQTWGGRALGGNSENCLRY